MKKFLTTSGLLIGLALFLAVNILSNTTFKSLRLDLTENNLYTLSEGTKSILTNLDEPVTLRFYLSEKLATQLPGINSYANRVKELLEEYQRYAGNKLRLEIIDPEPFSEQEDRAVGYGLQGVPIDNSNTSFYFGLVGTNAVDTEETITFFQPDRESFLEYDVSKLVYKLANPKQPVMGIMSSLPIQGNPNPFMQNAEQPIMIVDQLRQLFEVRNIETTATSIESDIDVLMVVHPKALSDSTLYAIDQFVLAGGRAMIFVDPYSETDTPPQNPQNPFANMNAPRNSDLAKLFDQWGVALLQGKVVGDMNLAQRVQIRKGSRAVVIEYPVYMDLNSPVLFSTNDIVTGDLGNVNVATAGSLTHKEGATTEMTPLMVSTEQAMAIDSTKLGMFADPEAMVKEFKPEQQFTLAARITGNVKTAFPDGKPAAEESEEAPAAPESDVPHLTESQSSINVIVVADTDMLQDQFWVQVQNFLGQRIALPLASNGDFVTNAIESLMGNNDLISVRSRGNFTRPFTKVEEIQKQAEQRFREKEQELQARLEQTEQKLLELQNQKQGGSALLLSTEQRQEIEGFRQQKVQIRKELRDVQHQLRKDIETLESQMKFINIGLIPLLIALGGLGLAFYRREKRVKLA
ncbi:Gldg family protein [Candidatus Albibeggiatoa sp. nov. NOAA]|uniref:Gldg family protein n=1 Tax=Candidatus Albibeggiatoa sp. nov. NOAA TaxID=3162724 RepID=UPI0032F628E7|nr:Gldg family protein [Thiotrichaceae bacterium]